MNHLEQYLAQGWLSRVGEGFVEIAFPQELGFTAKLLEQTGKLEELKKAVSLVLGKPTAVRFADTDSAPGAGQEEEEAGKDASKPWNPVEEPLVRRMLDLFEGRIVDGGKERTPF